MTEFEKQEFWEALSRLYNSALETHRATEVLRQIADSHERRLDRVEVTQQAILDELKRRKD